MSDTRRRELIARHLRERPAQSQAELAGALASNGVQTTQATISRDLASMGVLKGPHGYVLPEDTSGSAATAPETSLAVIRSHVLSAVAADSMVVLRSAPGHADMVAVELDRWPPTGVVGTIAGDDTIFVATTSRSAAQRVAAGFQSLMNNNTKGGG